VVYDMSSQPKLNYRELDEISKHFHEQYYFLCLNVLIHRPGSDTVLHISRIEFKTLSSCEVRRLNEGLDELDNVKC